MPYKWSLAKINKIDELIATNVDLNNLIELVETAKVRPKVNYINRKKFIQKIIDDIEYIKCTACNEFKLRECFNKKLGGGCKSCFKLIAQAFEATLRGFLLRRLQSAKYHAKERAKKNGRNDNSGNFTITLDIILDKIIEQKGRCYYSNIPLKFTRKTDWMASLERLDNCQGYTKENTVLVCVEFNCTDQSMNSNSQNSTSSKWTKDKFKYFMDHKP